MKIKKTASLIMGILFIVSITGIPDVQARSYQVDDLNVEVEMEPAKGENRMEIKIVGADGVVTNAKVKVIYTMPPMKNMPPMTYRANAKLDGERYKALLNLSMTGKWHVKIMIKRPGKSISKVEFELKV